MPRLRQPGRRAPGDISSTIRQCLSSPDSCNTAMPNAEAGGWKVGRTSSLLKNVTFRSWREKSRRFLRGVVSLTYLDVITGMQSIGLPCVYHKWSKAPPLPYTVILHDDNDDLMADNHNYQVIGNYRLELYTDTKHPPTEQLVENWFK